MVDTARKVDVKGKVILPLPSLIEAMAKKQLVINEVGYRKALYAPAFIKLIDALTKEFKLYPGKDGKLAFPSNRSYMNYMGYAVFDSFENYHIVNCNDPVDFTLSGSDNWVRPYDFGIYFHNSLKSDLNDSSKVAVQLLGCNGRYYITPRLRNAKQVPQEFVNEFMLSANTAIGQNARTTNAFMYKFGVQMKSPNLQSILDAGESILKQFSD